MQVQHAPLWKAISWRWPGGAGHYHDRHSSEQEPGIDLRRAGLLEPQTGTWNTGIQSRGHELQSEVQAMRFSMHSVELANGHSMLLRGKRDGGLGF